MSSVKGLRARYFNATVLGKVEIFAAFTQLIVYRDDEAVCSTVIFFSVVSGKLFFLVPLSRRTRKKNCFRSASCAISPTRKAMAVTTIESSNHWDEAFAEGHAAILIHSESCGPCNGFVPVWIALAPHFVKKRSDWALYSSLTTHATDIMTELDIMGVPQVILILCPHSTRLPTEMMKECRLVQRKGISRLVYVTKRWPNPEYLNRLTPWLIPTCGPSCCFSGILHQRRAKMIEGYVAPNDAEDTVEVTQTCAAQGLTFNPHSSPRKILRHHTQPQSPAHSSPVIEPVFIAPSQQTAPSSTPTSGSSSSSWLGNPLSFASPVSRESLNVIESTLEAFRDPVGYWTRRISRQNTPS